jgi:hypothetical protein
MDQSKFARKVGSMIGDELEIRRLETIGGERCMSKKVTHRIEGNLLHISYKIGRKFYKETFDYCESKQLDKELREHFGSTPPSMVTLATYSPGYYWMLYYHTNGKVDDALEAMKEGDGPLKKQCLG